MSVNISIFVNIYCMCPILFLLGKLSDAASVNPNGIKELLANGWSTFFINGKPGFSNGLRNLPRNPLDCTILENWLFDSLILGDKLLAKALRRSTSWWCC